MAAMDQSINFQPCVTIQAMRSWARGDTPPVIQIQFLYALMDTTDGILLKALLRAPILYSPPLVKHYYLEPDQLVYYYDS